MDQVYLDYSASTPVDKRVVEGMMPYFRNKYGNASSIHKFGRDAKSAIERSRSNISSLLKAIPEEIFFTSGGTESDNWAIIGYALKNKDKGKHIVTSVIEHPAVIKSCQYLETLGFEVTYIDVRPDGTLDMGKIEEAVRSDTIMLSFMHINNEIGNIYPLEEIGKIARNNNIVFHTDAVQGYGKILLDVNKMNIDLLSLSSHKIYGPKGVGALYIRKGIRVEKLIHGGSNERNMRSGTENTPGIVGLGKAAQICRKEMKKEAEILTGLRDYFWKRMQEDIPCARLNGLMENRLPGNLNTSFKDVDSESVLLSLDLHGIAVSSGSACSAGGIEPSPVIKALKLPPEYGDSAIRWTLGRFTTRDEIDYTMKILKEVVDRIGGL
ncbi:MAG: cysteine desulfurase [bacterium]|nr:cysteine desulfurase [bacterium]